MRCADDAAEHVGRAAGRERDDHGDRAVRDSSARRPSPSSPHRAATRAGQNGSDMYPPCMLREDLPMPADKGQVAVACAIAARVPRRAGPTYDESRRVAMNRHRVAIAGLGAIGARARAAGRRHAGAARSPRRAPATPPRRRLGSTREKIACPLVELDEFPEPTPISRSNARRRRCSSDLPADARGRQAGDGAVLPARCCRDPTWSSSPRRMAARSSCRPARCSGSTRSRRRPRAPSIRCG